MDKIVRYFVLILCSILHCQAVDFREQWEERMQDMDPEEEESVEAPSRRFADDMYRVGTILGAPSMASHLPPAEPILPGHTLIRPAMGMLKSSIKFPHKDNDNGAGVYGNINNLGIRYDGRNERVLYSGFRRSPADYIVVAPLKEKYPKSKFALSSLVLDLSSDEDDVGSKLLQALKRAKKTSHPKTTRIIQYSLRPIKKLSTNINLLNQGKIQSRSNSRPKTLRDTLPPVEEEEEEDEDDSTSSEDVDTHEESSTKAPENITNSKMEWFWSTKGTDNHIKINQLAPDQSELMPVNIGNNIRSWWFYHQDDYQPFQSAEE